jgi:hypothetical protein
MSAVPSHFMNDSSDARTARVGSKPDCHESEDGQSSFWVWFAVGVLIFCWIAEATMCAERGF